jgi:hypothetical protein
MERGRHSGSFIFNLRKFLRLLIQKQYSPCAARLIALCHAHCEAGRCRSWVNRVTLTARRSLPVFPDKQTFSGSVGMSQKCQ